MSWLNEDLKTGDWVSFPEGEGAQTKLLRFACSEPSFSEKDFEGKIFEEAQFLVDEYDFKAKKWNTGLNLGVRKGKSESFYGQLQEVCTEAGKTHGTVFEVLWVGRGKNRRYTVTRKSQYE